MPTVLLTGATGGLGRSVTKKLLDKGHRVIATTEPGSRHRQSVPEPHDKLFLHEIDLTDEAGCRTLVEKTVADHGSIDAAILLVGGFAMGSIEETDYSAVEQMIRLNFQTTYQMVRPLFSQMSRQPEGGRFGLIGARPALQASAAQHMVSYALSKSLVVELSAILNAAGKDKNIVSSVFIPSTIDTPANREAMPDADPGNWVKPDDFADLIEFVTFGPGHILREPVLKVYNRA